MRTLHSAPLDDLVEHDLETPRAECVCGPTLTLFRRAGSEYTWLLTHHSLDGREVPA